MQIISDPKCIFSIESSCSGVHTPSLGFSGSEVLLIHPPRWGTLLLHLHVTTHLPTGHLGKGALSVIPTRHCSLSGEWAGGFISIFWTIHNLQDYLILLPLPSLALPNHPPPVHRPPTMHWTRELQLPGSFHWR